MKPCHSDSLLFFEATGKGQFAFPVAINDRPVRGRDDRASIRAVWSAQRKESTRFGKGRCFQSGVRPREGLAERGELRGSGGEPQSRSSLSAECLCLCGSRQWASSAANYAPSLGRQIWRALAFSESSTTKRKSHHTPRTSDLDNMSTEGKVSKPDLCSGSTPPKRHVLGRVGCAHGSSLTTGPLPTHPHDWFTLK